MTMTISFLSWRASRLPHLASFLDGTPHYLLLPPFGERQVLAGWGRTWRARVARQLAARNEVPFLLLEDGFLRSVDRGDPPLSLVVDNEGIYYDANSPSKLERLVAAPLDDAQTARAQALIAAWREERVSKYNGALEYEEALPERFVLLCDQTFGDASIHYGHANEVSFARMLEAALAENPDCQVIVKTHPDVLTRKRRGYFKTNTLAKTSRVTVIAEACHPVRLIEEAAAVYTVTSQMGFEALIWGKKVRCFGMPFYAGWGLTEDDLPAPSRRGAASLEQLVHAALIAYPRYIDPETGERCEVERVLAHIALQRRMRGRFPAQIHAVGFSRWKRPILKRYLAGSDIRFSRRGSDVPSGSTVAVWGRTVPTGLPTDAQRLRLEDGFLRSVGLGADLTQPLSWVCDDVGLYYDPSRQSRLEQILDETKFDDALCARARGLRQTILDTGLTKYNVDVGSHATPWRRPDSGKPVILVPGQVEDDASIRLGAPGLKTNFGLLRAVRHANRHAHIIYKPHPDVVAGLRARGNGEESVANLCDEIVTRADMAQLLDVVDEVHTLTSLAGFEALMRGKRVTCYGQPFYAGWGLTRDMAPITRRGRRLQLDELVAGALILYPTYVSRVTGKFTTPEQAVVELIAWREAGGGRLPLWRKALRPVFGLFKATTTRRATRQEPEAMVAKPTEAAHGRE